MHSSHSLFMLLWSNKGVKIFHYSAVQGLGLSLFLSKGIYYVKLQVKIVQFNIIPLLRPDSFISKIDLVIMSIPYSLGNIFNFRKDFWYIPSPNYNYNIKCCGSCSLKFYVIWVVQSPALLPCHLSISCLVKCLP